MEFHLYKADKKRQKWSIRGDLWNGVTVKFPGHRNKKIAEQTMRNIASLNRSRHLGELPDPNLTDWINGLSDEEAQRYIHHELLPRRLWDKRRPIEEVLEEYKAHLTVNCKKRSRSPQAAVFRILRIFIATGAKRLDDLTLDKVKAGVNTLEARTGPWSSKLISQKTRVEYLSAIKTFCEWMVSENKASSNPLEKLDTSGAHSAPVRKRRPLTVANFRKLMRYLQSAPPKYQGQHFDWTPKDRLMLYWMAVMTGFRMNELRSLTPSHVNFDSSPVTVTVHGWHAKNNHSATIPIDDGLAGALREYCADKQPEEPLLRLPADCVVTLAFYRDLAAAGVPRKFDDGSTVDFHTLRSTAICWWVAYRRNASRFSLD